MPLAHHKKRHDFTAAKFTPATIANKKHIDDEELKAFFLDKHTLGDCAKKWQCAEVTIKRRLRALRVDTSIYNHTQVAADHSTCRKYSLSDAELRRLFIDENLDTKSIAELHKPPLHYNVIRQHVQRLGLVKDRKAVAKSMSARHIRRHGYRHPAQRPDVLAKTRKSTARIRYTDKTGRVSVFRSFGELAFALLLDKRDLEWYYEEMRVPYVDALTGKQRLYVIDFTVVHGDGAVEWVEIKPRNDMIPNDKRIFAARRAEDAGAVFRSNTDAERLEAKAVCDSGYRKTNIRFLRVKPRCNASQITYWFKTASAAQKFKMLGWHHKRLVRYSPTWYSLVLERDP